MHFYLATSFIFPRSLRLRLFTLCFIATHLPLLGYCVWGLATGRIGQSEFILLALATLIGAIGALAGIGALLTPIHTLADTLHRTAQDAKALPDVGDVIHTLYTVVQRAATMTRSRMDALHSAAHEDVLTGLANRRAFLSQMSALSPDAARGCIAMIDIDHFKQANDQFGHEEGDRILTAFADRLAAQLRRADSVARWGGEEFVVFFPQCIEDEACWTLSRVANRLRDDPVGQAHGRPISFSAGICRWNGQPIEAIMEAADRALDAAKRAGRDRVCRAMPLVMES